MRKHEIKEERKDNPITRTSSELSFQKSAPLTKIEREMLTTLSDMERWFEDALHRPFQGFHRLPLMNFQGERRGGDFIPPVDMFEEAGDIVIRAELAGIKREDIKVELSGNTLTLSGEKRGEEKVERKDYYSVEQAFGSFRRSLELPAGVDQSKVKASYKDGLLEIRMPRNIEAQKVQSIPIEE